MPFAKFKSVREVSSEDKVHSAENLIKLQPGKKWKTKNSGEKSAYVILEFEEPYEIVGFDIGNENSAFVEILVGGAACAREDFKEILMTCSFMTPIESKNSSNPNRVRCFNREALISTVTNEKWHMIKIICTQPFNKHIQYGLSFIKVHVANCIKKVEKNEKPELNLHTSTKLTEKPTVTNIGKFALREESPESEEENTSNLFNRWKLSRNSNDGTTNSPFQKPSHSENAQKLKNIPYNDGPSISKCDAVSDRVLDRNRDEIMYNTDDGIDTTKKEKFLSKHIEADKERLKKSKETTNEESPKPKGQIKNHLSDIADRERLNKSNETPSRETTKQGQLKKRPSDSASQQPSKKMKETNARKYCPFNQLLRGVVLVVSGIQNPDRTELRNKALALGAKYKADWDNTCTHLICAFKNTPKYNAVKGKGKIVTRSWIEKCYELKKYLPWRRYALDNVEVQKPESDEEIWDESLKPKYEEEPISSLPVATEKDIIATYDLETDKHNISSGSDTDDDIRRLTNEKKSTVVKSPSSDIYDASTEEEDYLEEKIKLNSINL